MDITYSFSLKSLISRKEGRATGIPTIREKLRKNGSLPARIETDDERSYFLIEIPCRDGFQNAIEPITQESELKSELKNGLKTLRITLDLIAEDPKATAATLVARSGKSRSTVQKSIRILKDEHCIDRVGGKKNGRWMFLMSYPKYLICNYNWTISSLYEDGFN